jgi:hypothetical protein
MPKTQKGTPTSVPFLGAHFKSTSRFLLKKSLNFCEVSILSIILKIIILPFALSVTNPQNCYRAATLIEVIASLL